MHLEEATNLIDNIVKPTRLVTGRRLERVAVHGIADPRHHSLRGAHLLHDRGQSVANFAGTHPRDERQPARLAVGVELVDQAQEVVRVGFGAHLDPDGVANPGEEVDVCSPDVAGALPHPDEVAGDVIRLTSA